MEQTPIQQAIEKLKKEQLEYAQYPETYKPYQRAINILKVMLPAEREFAEKCYVAGALDFTCVQAHPDKFEDKDFDNYYSRFQPK